MAENKHHLAIGEETTRGTAESATVGYIPLTGPAIPFPEYDDQYAPRWIGEEAALGERLVRRMSQKWGHTFEFELFTEAGVTAGMVGTVLKHFFGKATSAQNGTTGQYDHSLVPVANPFSSDSGHVGNKALTFNVGLNEGSAYKRYPFVGGRVKSLTFTAEPGGVVKMSAESFGQFLDTIATNTDSVTFPAENLRLDYNNLTLYTGTIGTTGSAPDFTDFTTTSATVIKPDNVTVKFENGMEDALRIAGVDYPDKTRLGRFKGSLEFSIDWEDPSSGFSSVDELNAYLSAASTNNFLLKMDTGTQAGTGDNHSLYLYMPSAQRMFKNAPEYAADKDPLITFNYEMIFDETAACAFMALLKNTASSV